MCSVNDDRKISVAGLAYRFMSSQEEIPSAKHPVEWEENERVDGKSLEEYVIRPHVECIVCLLQIIPFRPIFRNNPLVKTT